jgi:hypothetical protein
MRTLKKRLLGVALVQYQNTLSSLCKTSLYRVLLFIRIAIQRCTYYGKADDDSDPTLPMIY